MLRVIIISSALVLTGTIIGINIAPESSNSSINDIAFQNETTANGADKDAFDQAIVRVKQLEIKMDQSEKRNLELSDKIASLNESVNQLQKLIKSSAIDNSDAGFEQTHQSSSITQPNEFENSSENQSKTDVLLSLGVDNIIADRIQKKVEEREMNQLYLRNTSIREGWFGTEKYFEKSRELAQESNVYRDELGDVRYDEYLFQSDQTNRVSITSIIATSPAEKIGLQTNDIILEYDNQRIFSWSDITQLTAEGENGETVSLVIQRDNSTIELFIPRGPLGVRLENIKVDPTNS